ncbi:hypothetical protein ABNG03_10115 [Halorubrum sp. RMP-47]|uniref:Uncharacterized protein n=1 Tax=Halorubrum miltondacostae TaxID=3076378 RepID=A0ABD5M165_9EURY
MSKLIIAMPTTTGIVIATILLTICTIKYKLNIFTTKIVATGKNAPKRKMNTPREVLA